MADGRVPRIWQGFEENVAECDVHPPTSRAAKEAGDFEVRLGKRRIGNATANQGVGVSRRRVPTDVAMR